MAHRLISEAEDVSTVSADADIALRQEEAWPFYAEDEIEAVTQVLRSGKVNQWTGPDVFAFEQACARVLGGGPGVALANGSLALELALRAFGIGPGDEVIVSPRSFVASAFCTRLVGATPVFADVDHDSGNISADTIAPLLSERTKAIIPVHLAGWPADIAAMRDLASPHGIKIIEDCAQAHGAAIDGAPVGTFGDAAAFSFCQDKIISTGGEGGYVSFRDEAAYERAWSFKDHGKDRSKALAPPGEPGLFRWLHDSVGTNWRLAGLQAAIGIVQLRKLSAWREARAANAAIWAAALRGVTGLRVPMPEGRFRHAFYKFYVYVDAPAGDAEALRRQILLRGTRAGLRIFSGSCSEMYREEGFGDLGVAELPMARALGETSLMMEIHPTLDRERLHRRAELLAHIAQDILA